MTQDPISPSSLKLTVANDPVLSGLYDAINARDAMLLATRLDAMESIPDHDDYGHLSVHAVRRTNPEALKVLYARGVGLPGSFRFAYHCLHTAAGLEDGRPLVELLLDHGADPNETDMNGQGTLGIAVMNGRTHSLALLVARGADVHSGDRYQNTALHVAASQDEAACCTILLGLGARSEQRNFSKMTARQMAELHQSGTVIEALNIWEQRAALEAAILPGNGGGKLRL